MHGNKRLQLTNGDTLTYFLCHDTKSRPCTIRADYKLTEFQQRALNQGQHLTNHLLLGSHFPKINIRKQTLVWFWIQIHKKRQECILKCNILSLGLKFCTQAFIYMYDYVTLTLDLWPSKSNLTQNFNGHILI